MRLICKVKDWCRTMLEWCTDKDIEVVDVNNMKHVQWCSSKLLHLNKSNNSSNNDGNKTKCETQPSELYTVDLWYYFQSERDR